MNKVLIIGAGGVGGVSVNKCLNLKSDLIGDVCLASRTLEKCKIIADQTNKKIRTEQVDANNTADVIKLIQSFKPRIVINAALPLQNIPIMKACLETGVHYIDTSDPEMEPDKFELLGSYRWQWQFDSEYKKRGLTAILSCGFDPGVVNVYCAYAQEHIFDEIVSIDIVDCNGGDHGHPFATNFNPIVNLQEVTAPGIYYENNKWVEIKALSVKKSFYFPEIGSKNMYVMYHPELESLAKFLKPVKSIRFWMTFSDSYLNHLDVFENLGLISMDPITVRDNKIIPLEFLQAALPDPSELGKNYKGKTCIGCIFTGMKDGREKTIFIYNVCDHHQAYLETKNHAVPYTTGVPAVTAAQLLLDGTWQKPGIYNVEQLDPLPFLEKIGPNGLPWDIKSIENPFTTDKDLSTMSIIH